MKSKAFSLILSVLLALFAVSASVAAPICIRPFYYAHIDALHMPETTGWSREQIQEAFDDVMDYLLKGAEYRTGVLAWSESGRDHFADCKALFHLDLWILACTALALLASFAWYRRKNETPARLAGRGPSFWAGLGILACFGSFAAFAALDFDRAFTLFHTVFFPGKSNWIFDPDTDQIICILPQTFFRNCAILIGVLLAIFVAVYLFAGRKQKPCKD